MSKNQFIPTPAYCRQVVRVRRDALCPTARTAYDADALTRCLINTLWVIGQVDRQNGRTPFRPAGKS